MLRTHTCGELTLADLGKEISLCGWVQKSRDLGGMTFVDIRDRYGITQLAFNTDDNAELRAKARELGREFVISVQGTVIERSSKNLKMLTGEIEISVSAITILNPAPYQEISADLLALCDWIIPNETEFRELHGELPTNDQILKSFRPGKNSIVTLGTQGAAYISADGELTRVTAPHVTAVDTTGAGDAFVGTFAYSIASGKDPVSAMTLGIKVATLSVTRKGAQSSYPDQAEIATLS
jgi:sugar/nucleoside kinase (ribokinase family)